MVLTRDEIKDLMLKANEVRRWVIELTYHAKSGHPGGSLSAADILTALYFKILRVDPKNPRWEDRDRFVLSKGHAAPAYYAVLAMKGFFPKEELYTLRKVNSRLQGHPSLITPGVDMATGSLGQGLSAAIGMALAARIDKKDYKVFVMLGDGECHEGNVWEGAMFASHHKLDNLVAIVDRNMIQLDGFTEEIVALESFSDKWRSFGWWVQSINGHDFNEIVRALKYAIEYKGRPSVIIARTIKGKGISYMENNPAYHGKPPQNEEEYRKAIEELEEERKRIMEM